MLLGRYDATPKFIKKLLAHQAAKAVVYLAGTQPELDGAAAGLLRTIDSARGQRVGPKRDRWARPPKMAGQPAMRAPRAPRRIDGAARRAAGRAAAAARPYLGCTSSRSTLGAWVRNDSLAPTFDRRLLSYAPHFHEAQMGRNRKYDTGHDTSWRWAWFACRVPFSPAAWALPSPARPAGSSRECPPERHRRAATPSTRSAPRKLFIYTLECLRQYVDIQHLQVQLIRHMLE